MATPLPLSAPQYCHSRSLRNNPRFFFPAAASLHNNNGVGLHNHLTSSTSSSPKPPNSSSSSSKSSLISFRIRAIKEKTQPEVKGSSEDSSSPEEFTKKYGLEAGLWKIFSSKEQGKEDEEKKKSKGEQAKELLKKYGGAYLATSITLSLVSFFLCYALVSAGLDVQALLFKVGISANETGEKVGTFALAYAAHKAASPIRFPPTVALTPVVANWIGKKKKADEEN